MSTRFIYLKIFSFLKVKFSIYLNRPVFVMGTKRESLPYWVDVQAGLSLCWLHRSYYRFCLMLAQMVSDKI